MRNAKNPKRLSLRARHRASLDTRCCEFGPSVAGYQTPLAPVFFASEKGGRCFSISRIDVSPFASFSAPRNLVSISPQARLQDRIKTVNPKADNPPASPAAPSLRRTRRLYQLPALVFALIALSLYLGLKRDPTLVPSPLVGKTVPEFALDPVKGRDLGLSSDDLKEAPSLVNVFASWCVACRHEHSLLLDLDRAGTIAIHGINYKDDPEAAKKWLDDLGDPYTRTGVDAQGRIGLEWGVYGVPETFLVDAKGRIVYKHIGPLTRQDIDGTLLPLMRALDAPEGG